MLRLSQSWLQRPRQASSVPSDTCPSFFGQPLTFSCDKIVQAHLGLSCLSPGMGRFFKEPWFLFVDKALEAMVGHWQCSLLVDVCLQVTYTRFHLLCCVCSRRQLGSTRCLHSSSAPQAALAVFPFQTYCSNSERPGSPPVTRVACPPRVTRRLLLLPTPHLPPRPLLGGARSPCHAATPAGTSSLGQDAAPKPGVSLPWRAAGPCWQ